MIEDFYTLYPEAKKTFDEKYAGYDFVNGVPQQILYVKLQDGTSAENR